jgi:hypothetical protein
MSCDGDERAKVQTLKPDVATAEPHCIEAYDMRPSRLGHQHILQRLPFLGNLEITVALLALKIVVQVD